VAVNTTAEPLPAPVRGEPRLETVEGALLAGKLKAHAGVVGQG
jgi:hypothetical protein